MRKAVTDATEPRRRGAALRATLLVGYSLVASTFSLVAIIKGTPGFALPALVSVVVGAYLILRAPENTVGAALMVFGSATIASAFAETMLIDSVSEGSMAAPASRIMLIVAGSVFVLIGAASSTLFLVFPTGTARPGWVWIRRAIYVFAGAGALTGVMWSATVEIHEGIATTVTSGVDSGNPAEIFAAIIFVLGFPLSVAALVARYRAADSVGRSQIGYLILAASFLLAVSIVGMITQAHDAALFGVATSVGFALIPLAVGLAVARYRLYDIDKLISRTISYAIVVGVLAVGFAAILAVPTVLLGSSSEAAPTLLVATATLAAFLAFNPLRRRVQSEINRRFNRLPYDPQRVSQVLGKQLRDTVEMRELEAAWLASTVDSLHPSAAAVWARELG